MSNELSTMWSYNGIELPKLPDVDREQYPYAYIWHFKLTSDLHTLIFVSDYEFFLDDTNTWKVRGIGARKVYGYRTSYGDWQESDEPQDGEHSGTSIGGLSLMEWSNFDILNEDGSIYLAASEPVPIFKIEPMSFYKGVYVGQMIASMRWKLVAQGKKEIIAYLYNDVQLPDINEVWTDKEAYPDAVIFKHKNLDEYYLFLLSEQLHMETFSGAAKTSVAIVVDKNNTPAYKLDKDNSTWTRYTPQYNTHYTYKYNIPDNAPQVSSVWSSYDIMWDAFGNYGGEMVVYIATGSEPVPVYE